jgi:hypothetical protein
MWATIIGNVIMSSSIISWFMGFGFFLKELEELIGTIVSRIVMLFFLCITSWLENQNFIPILKILV